MHKYVKKGQKIPILVNISVIFVNINDSFKKKKVI